ncbi:nucleoside triphosphate pyrophosphohydrolase family protein [Pseudonocardia parietis]|uniref:NTP pyrophosphatase (Non-canonical NTP hydrolase) n=1 Tax=Pseudonocardia parietis TaxID=570936 RepID=A0ABS4W254_9PSEU|nr:nucleoside triphosphate pyrophosphohydrolase family protein [Pseudonocardia parietis]MBP2370288.1 NTP pyrophosphatase (non-canonical NTP hydrolase) [Pseudonocardia parietis]
MNGFDEYQIWSRTTAFYPGAGSGRLAGLSYTALGLAGEAGEIANKVKKLVRDGDDADRRNELIHEIGDVLWYAARIADELSFSLSDLAALNRAKLESRAQRGVLGGSGDDR